jgi:hypothetical protein
VDNCQEWIVPKCFDLQQDKAGSFAAEMVGDHMRMAWSIEHGACRLTASVLLQLLVLIRMMIALYE